MLFDGEGMSLFIAGDVNLIIKGDFSDRWNE